MGLVTASLDRRSLALLIVVKTCLLATSISLPRFSTVTLLVAPPLLPLVEIAIHPVLEEGPLLLTGWVAPAHSSQVVVVRR